MAASKTATTKSTPVKSTTPSVDSVKATQISLNQKGANLKVDGILGPKTQAAQTKFGSSSSSTSSNKVLSPTIKSNSSSSTSYNKYGSSTPKPVGSVISAPTKKTGFFDKVGNFIGDAINTGKKIVGGQTANAYSGYVDNPMTYNNGMIEDAPFSAKPFSGVTSAVKDTFTPTYKPAETVNTNTPSQPVTPQNNVQNSGALEVTASGPTGYISNLNPGGTPLTSGNTTTSKTTTPLADGSTNVVTSVSNPVAAPITINPGIASNVTGLVDSYLKNSPTPWVSDKGEFQKNETIKLESGIASQFQDPNQVMSEYTNNAGFQTSINKAASKAGITPQEMINNISSKVQTATNGVLPAQDTAQYLDLINTKNTPASLKATADLLNKSIIENSQFNTSQEKLAYDMATKQREDSQTMIDNLDRKTLKLETTEREKGRIAIQKAQAEFDLKDAETEQNRITAMTNLKEFLAHIGALNTDGNAQVGLETLNQKYQAQRQQLRNNFNMSVAEINMNMDDHINTLESNLDDNILKLNMDLSKTEREVTMEILKLRNDTKKEAISAQLKYAEMIKTEKDKAETKANSNANNFNDSLIKLTTGSNPLSYAAAMSVLGSNGKIIPTEQNINTINSAKSAPETKPAYKGETFKDSLFTTKSVQKFLDAGMKNEFDIQWTQDQLQQGWSLEQVAKNSNMPTSIYNLFKTYIQ